MGREATEDHPAKAELGLQDGGFYIVPISRIEPDPDQPRKHFDPEALEDLAKSIRQKGILQPILVRIQESTELLRIVAGERRYRASRMAEISEMPVILTKGNPREIALIENLQRDNLKPMEESEALQVMIDEHGYTQAQLGSAIGKSQSSISESLILNKLPEEIKDEIRATDRYPKKALLEIARASNAKSMRSMFQRLKSATSARERGNIFSRKQAIVLLTEKIADVRVRLGRVKWENLKDEEKNMLREEIVKLRQVCEKIE